MNERNFFEDAWRKLTRYQNDGDDFDQPEEPQKLEVVLKEDKKEPPERVSEHVKTYRQMEEISKKDSELNILFRDIKMSVLRYIEAIDSLSLARANGADPETINQADRMRSIAHNALISNINIMSRYCAKLGIDNEWRFVLGLDRKQITAWALEIFPIVIKELKEREDFSEQG